MGNYRKEAQRHSPPTLDELLGKNCDVVENNNNNNNNNNSLYTLENFARYLQKSHSDENLQFIMVTQEFLNQSDTPSTTTSTTHSSSTTSKSKSSESHAYSFKIKPTALRDSKLTQLFKKSPGGVTPTTGSSGSSGKTLREWNEKCYLQYIEEDSPKQCNLPECIRKKFDVCYANNEYPTLASIKEARLHIRKTLYSLYQQWCSYVADNYTEILAHGDVQEDKEEVQEEEEEEEMDDFASKLAHPQEHVAEHVASVCHVTTASVHSTESRESKELDFSKLSDPRFIKKISPFLFQPLHFLSRVGSDSPQNSIRTSLSSSNSSGSLLSGTHTSYAKNCSAAMKNSNYLKINPIQQSLKSMPLIQLSSSSSSSVLSG